MSFSPTPEQKAAIEARGGSLLLSAAAGSGKTAVLTERAVSRMLDPVSPVPADRLLIVTFTRAAAAEMKERIVKKLAEHIAQNPGDAAARRQRTLLDRASIGTIHSVCAELLRQNFQRAGLPAAFRIGDDNELDAMREEAVSAVLEDAYRAADPGFLELARLLSSSRNDKGLSDAVLRVLEFARAHPFYRRWLDEKLEVYRNFSAPQESVWADILFPYGAGLASFAAERLRAGLAVIAADDTLAGYEAALRSDLAFAEAVEKAARSRDWDGCVRLLAAYGPERLGGARKADPAAREAVKALRARAKGILSETLPQKVFCTDAAGFADDVTDLLPKIACLFGLVCETDGRLQAEKLSQGVVDFTDLEQLTCSLLVDEGGGKTPLAEECAARYDEVMIDEFQDVNEVQNSILTALARDDNLFCVGDVKQSVYRFRMAQPKLFLDRAERWHAYDGAHFPAVLRLNGSFRTAPAVTGLINEMFSALMSVEVGELCYDDRQKLVPLGKFPPAGEYGVDLCLIEDGAIADEDGGDAAAEPAWVAGEISRLLREGVTADGETLRRLEPRDIAILLRSPSSRAEGYRRALERAGIEAAVSLENGFLDTPEITAVTNALHAIANPLRDIELLGAMASPLFGFTDDELAAVRVKTPAGRLWNAVVNAAEENRHVGDFVRQLASLRRLSLSAPPADVVGELLRQTGFDVLCRSMKNGARRAANLALLQEYAMEPCGGGLPTLEGFLRRLDRLRERGKDLAPAAVGEGVNAVTITSIHKSKGLEWPVAFVCDTAKRHSFYRNDMIEPTILHSQLGFACVRRDEAAKRQFVTAPLAAVRVEAERGFLSEELRVLYVAMTRAKERLFLTAAVRDPAARLFAAAQDAAGLPLAQAKERAEPPSLSGMALPPAQVREGRCFLDWLLPAFSMRHDLAALSITGNRADGLRVFAGEACAPSAPVQSEAPAEAQADAALLSRLRERLSFAYPYEEAARLPAKLAASALVHGDTGRYFTAKPAFLSDEGLTGAARGTAVHAYMQFCDYAAAARDPAAELSRLRESGVLTAAQAGAVELSQIETFFASRLAKRIFAADRALREFRFLAPASASPLAAAYALPGGEATMLQGVADCILMEGDHAVLLDYKTDRVKGPEKLVALYRTQLLLYRDMLGEALGVPVTEGYLYSFALGREIAVDFSK